MTNSLTIRCQTCLLQGEVASVAEISGPGAGEAMDGTEAPGRAGREIASRRRPVPKLDPPQSS
jgi:hypothetical protein